MPVLKYYKDYRIEPHNFDWIVRGIDIDKDLG